MTEKKELKILNSDVNRWIEDHPDQFKPKCKIVYDEENLKRIKRFAGSPIEYLIERIELNKAVLKNYHKLHHTILMAGLTGFYAIAFSQLVLSIAENWSSNSSKVESSLWMIGLLIGLAFLAYIIRLPTRVLKWSGLLRVIRDSEIEIYYLSKILESRELNLTKTISTQTKLDVSTQD